MKLRKGFVSNSSSSSFILRVNNEFKTVKDVAKYIIDICKSAWDYDKDLLIDELKTLKQIKDPDTPIYFNTGGDKTFIRKMDDKILITTTQNATFYSFFNYKLNDNDVSNDFYKQFEHINEYGDFIEVNNIEDLNYFYEIFNDFLVLKYNFIGKPIYINCKKCGIGFGNGWKLQNGKNFCNCQINKIIRSEKLKTIKK